MNKKNKLYSPIICPICKQLSCTYITNCALCTKGTKDCNMPIGCICKSTEIVKRLIIELQYYKDYSDNLQVQLQKLKNKI